MSKFVESREGHVYNPPGEERTTPVEEIPPRFRKKVDDQILDIRLTYNWDAKRGKYVECGSKAASSNNPKPDHLKGK